MTEDVEEGRKQRSQPSQTKRRSGRGLDWTGRGPVLAEGPQRMTKLHQGPGASKRRLKLT